MTQSISIYGRIKEEAADLPRLVRDQIIQEYLSGRKTCAMLGIEYGICRKSINMYIIIEK